VAEYVAPNNQNCRIKCPGSGGAVYIPPYTCHTWCDSVESAIAAFTTALRTPAGWDFKSNLTARFSGEQASEIASTLIRADSAPPPSDVRNTLSDMVFLGSQNIPLEFDVVWKNEMFSQALVILLSELQNAIRLR
jgi:hypothetical protein